MPSPPVDGGPVEDVEEEEEDGEDTEEDQVRAGKPVWPDGGGDDGGVDDGDDGYDGGDGDDDDGDDDGDYGDGDNDDIDGGDDGDLFLLPHLSLFTDKNYPLLSPVDSSPPRFSSSTSVLHLQRPIVDSLSLHLRHHHFQFEICRNI